MAKNRLKKTKGKHLPERGCTYQTETSMCRCVYTCAYIICYQFLLVSMNFILNLFYETKELLMNAFLEAA